jgi:hypothetical protein
VPSISTVAMERALAAARRSHVRSENSSGRRRTSTSERAVISSAAWPASTSKAYQGAVGASYNEARMLPSSTDTQFVLSSQLDIEPSTSVNYYVDYFGTRVAAFDVLAGHAGAEVAPTAP